MTDLEVSRYDPQFVELSKWVAIVLTVSERYGQLTRFGSCSPRLGHIGCRVKLVGEYGVWLASSYVPVHGSKAI